MMQELISFNEAKEAGLLRYFTGRPCKRGHISERWVSTRNCLECSKYSANSWRREHNKECSATSKVWRANNREKVRLLKRKHYRGSTQEKTNQAARSRRWFLANKEKAMVNSLSWRERNPDKHAALHAASQQRRRTALLRRMPAWANHDEIQSFYHLAREMTVKTGVPHEVDHMIPLMGKLVSGLHVSNNLRVVPAKVNRTKGARFCWEDLQETA